MPGNLDSILKNAGLQPVKENSQAEAGTGCKCQAQAHTFSHPGSAESGFYQLCRHSNNCFGQIITKLEAILLEPGQPVFGLPIT